MPPSQPSRFWQRCRTWFRHVRITVWLILLALLSTLVYLNQVGLPNFVKKPLLQKLRDRGLELEFTRLRLSFYHGIQAQNVRFGKVHDPLGPVLTAADVGVELDPKALLKLQLQVNSLSLSKGRFAWPVSTPTQPGRELAIEQIQTELRFLPEDRWELGNFRARFAGAELHAIGSVNHASAASTWGLGTAKYTATTAQWSRRIQGIANTLEQVHFTSPPEFRLFVHGDARDLRTFTVQLSVIAPDADTPWGKFSKGDLRTSVAPSGTNSLSHFLFTLRAQDADTKWAVTRNLLVEVQAFSGEAQTNLADVRVKLSADGAQTRWVTARNIKLSAQLAPEEMASGIIRGNLDLTAADIYTPWVEGTHAQLTGQWVHSLTNPVPLTGEATFTCKQPGTKWACAEQLQLNAHLARLESASMPPIDASTVWWTNLWPYQVQWACRATGLRFSNLVAQSISSGGEWLAPSLTATNLHLQMDEGRIDARASLNVSSRATSASITSDIDPLKVRDALPEAAGRWLSQFTWQTPPQLQGQIQLVLPAWTNRQPDWAVEVQPTLNLKGHFLLASNATYRGLAVTSAKSEFGYSNMCWHLADLVATTPEGRLEAEHYADDHTKDFLWKIRCTIDPNSVRPVLSTNAAKVLELFTLTQPPLVEAEVRGRSHDKERTWVKGRVALSNFTFRGESFSGVQTALEYTNRMLVFSDPRVYRGTQYVSADLVLADFNAQKVYLTNGFSTAEPDVIARAIGAHIGRAIEPYHFSIPPTAGAYGIIPMHGEKDADLHFVIEGGPFHWSKFNVRKIRGEIHWRGLQLRLSKVRADFYGGAAGGDADFTFHSGQPTEVRFTASVTNSLLQPLVTDYFGRTNQLEGYLTGDIAVTRALTEDWHSVNGYGQLKLSDGLIWDIPMFGIFSPILNGIMPGLGNSRATAANCSFTMTNGVLNTPDLEIRTASMRLRYRGNMDLQGDVNARVEAELLRDVWLVGPIVSTVFWPVTKMFEYKVSGSVAHPKTEPVYIIPKLVLLPFQPFRALKGLLEEPNAGGTSQPQPSNK